MPRSNSQPRLDRKINFFKNNFPLTNKLKRPKENFEKKITRPKLMDENYEYDEDENDQRRSISVPMKKNKTFSNFIFFKLNKDRASIYKKMNDLRKLQMAYFGGRFLNTHNINNGQNVIQGSNNIFDEIVSNYFKRQNQDSNYDRNKKRSSNFRKKLVEKISANRKLRDKTSFLNKNRNNTLKSDFRTNKTFDRFKKKNRDRINYSAKSKKIGGSSKNNDRAVNKYKKMEHKKLYSKSIYEEKNEDINKKLKDKFRSKSTKNIYKEAKNKK
jgi:hypothetical protein